MANGTFSGHVALEKELAEAKRKLAMGGGGYDPDNLALEVFAPPG